ncbi:MAG: ABC transporter permease [Armatimonadota bacterium]
MKNPPRMLPEEHPIFWEELRRRVFGRRNRRVPLLKGLLYLAVGLGVLPLFNLFGRPEFHQGLWHNMLAVQGFLAMLLAPGFAVGSFTSERERGSLDFLFLTPQSTKSLTLQKFGSACALLLLILLFFLPVSLSSALLGHVRIETFAGTYLLQIAQGLCFVAFGLLASSLARNTRTATAVTYLAILALEYGGQAFFTSYLQPAIAAAYPQTSSLLYGLGLNLLATGLHLALGALALWFCVLETHKQRTPIAHGSPAPKVSRSVIAPNHPRWHLPDTHPVLWDDLRRRLRGGRAFTVMLGFGLALCAILVVTTLLADLGFDPEAWPELGHTIFYAAMIGQLVMVLIIAPGLTATIFSSERENRRVDFLLITRLTSRELVYGKCFGAVALLMLTLLCGAPIMAIIAGTFGGISPLEFGIGYLALLLCGLFCASTALLYSCKAKNSSAALLQGYLISTLGMLGVAGLSFVCLSGFPIAIIEVIRNLNHASRRLDNWRRPDQPDPYTLPLMQEAEDNR